MLMAVKLGDCYSSYEAQQTTHSVIYSVQRYFFSECVFLLHVHGDAGNNMVVRLDQVLLQYSISSVHFPYCVLKIFTM
jgi:hypothetical protein